MEQEIVKRSADLLYTVYQFFGFAKRKYWEKAGDGESNGAEKVI
jgi:hypothetical protein